MSRSLKLGPPIARGFVAAVFVGSTAGNVYALTLRGGSVVKQQTILKGLAESGGIAFQDGALYVADRTQILRSNPDGSAREVVARGIRNSVGFDWHPQTRELWFTENGQDALGPDPTTPASWSQGTASIRRLASVMTSCEL
jgi:hypothetical protein